jgi:uncharacterized protein YidB (DUF937 family)
MGLLDSVIGNLLGGSAGSASSPMGSVLSNILGGGQSGTAGQGGLGGLLTQFQNAGLGHIADSWVGNGTNQAVTPNQLQNVFGQDRVNDMANQAGMAPGDFLSQLSQHLPAAVDHMTPNGQAPDDGSVSV